MIYTDKDGGKWRPVAEVPYCELTPGSRYAMQGESEVCVSVKPKPTPSLDRSMPWLVIGLRNSKVILLEKIEA